MKLIENLKTWEMLKYLEEVPEGEVLCTAPVPVPIVDQWTLGANLPGIDPLITYSWSVRKPDKSYTYTDSQIDTIIDQCKEDSAGLDRNGFIAKLKLEFKK